MVLSTISASEIYLAITNFKPKVSRDELDISMKLIQSISSSIIVPLMYIFNKSFKSDIYILFVMVYPKVLFLDHYFFLYLLMI